MNQQPTTERKALIIGGGIGGPTAAMALQRAGIEATVYEAYDRPADYVGLFLNTASNGLDVLKTLDAHAPVIEDAFPAPHMVMWNGTGKRLGEVANGLRLPDGTVSVVVKRGFLQRVLADEGKRTEMGSESLRIVARHDIEEVLVAFENLYELAMPRRRDAGKTLTGTLRSTVAGAERIAAFVGEPMGGVHEGFGTSHALRW